MSRPSPTKRPCIEPDCPAIAVKRGWCSRHYQAHRTRRAPTGSDPRCTIPGCNRRHHARGWCNRHYLRWKQHGDPNICLAEGRPDAPPIPPTVVRSVRLDHALAAQAEYLACLDGVTIAEWMRRTIAARVTRDSVPG